MNILDVGAMPPMGYLSHDIRKDTDPPPQYFGPRIIGSIKNLKCEDLEFKTYIVETWTVKIWKFEICKNL